MKHATPAEPARPGPRSTAAPAVPLRADAFTLPAPRLRDLTRAELAASGLRDAEPGNFASQPLIGS
jgi:hypothetical protein